MKYVIPAVTLAAVVVWAYLHLSHGPGLGHQAVTGAVVIAAIGCVADVVVTARRKIKSRKPRRRRSYPY